MHIIDPMHNLFLGTAKKMLEIWQDNGLLLKRQLLEIQTVTLMYHQVLVEFQTKSVVDLLVLLQTRLKIGFVSTQFQLCLEFFLLTTWHHFVLACCILCKPIVSQNDVQLCDLLLLRFSQSVRVERLYTSSITPNMLMHCHLKDVITNYGPVHGFLLNVIMAYSKNSQIITRT